MTGWDLFWVGVCCVALIAALVVVKAQLELWDIEAENETDNEDAPK